MNEHYYHEGYLFLKAFRDGLFRDRACFSGADETLFTIWRVLRALSHLRDGKEHHPTYLSLCDVCGAHHYEDEECYRQWYDKQRPMTRIEESHLGRGFEG